MTRVMIAVDGSDLDERLAEAAHDLFGQDAEYWAVNVRNSPYRAPSGVVHAVPGLYAGAFVAYGAAFPFTLPRHDGAAGGSAGPDDDAASSRRAAEAAADSAGIEDAEVLTESGDPPAAILDAADRHAADVIVVGSRDRSWWTKLIESSVSSDVIEDASVPVLVISDAS